MNLIKLNHGFPTPYFPTIFDEIWNEYPQIKKDFLQYPAANVKESEKDYLINLAVPGLKKDDLKINLKGSVLTISAENKTKLETENKEKNFHRFEYNYSQFSRSFTLPNSVSTEKIEANLENGELKIRLPKKEAIEKPITEIVIN